jgi:hypothetical protein
MARARLGIAGAEEIVAYARAHRLVYLRRYAAKIAYELELTGSCTCAATPRRSPTTPEVRPPSGHAQASLCPSPGF